VQARTHDNDRAKADYMSAFIWAGFLCIYVALLLLDLTVLHRESKVLSIAQAVSWTIVWILVAMAAGGLVYGLYEYDWVGWHSGFGHINVGGRDALIQYITGYFLEWSLSIDNIFVIALIFSYMKIPLALQYRVLFWGIVGAIVLRGAMIAMGAALVHSFDWSFYLFGAILILSAVRMLRDDGEYDPDKSRLMKFTRRLFPISDQLDGERFITRINGARVVTPLFVTLVFVDFADVIFAVDSIPAIFAVTQDPFLVLTSNAFAILGLRSLYFAIASMMDRFRYLKLSLVAILGFVGVKMLLTQHVHISNLYSLAVILGMLGCGVVASVVAGKPTATERS
jgi:tellurite resistance protein TerC